MPTRRRFLLSSLGLLGFVPLQGFAVERDASQRSGATETRRKRLLYFTSDSCPLCRAFDRIELKSLKADGWKIGQEPSSHLQILNVDYDRDAAGRYEITSVPALICVELDKELRRWDGKNSFDRWTLNKVYIGEYRFPHYPIRDEWWTLNDTTDHTVTVMVEHLQSGYHANKFDRRWLEELTIDELHSLHSDDHDDSVRSHKAVKRNAELSVEPARSNESQDGTPARRIDDARVVTSNP